MKRKERDYLSAESEPALGGGGELELDPSEEKIALREQLKRGKSGAEIDVLRDSVLSEPSLDPGARAKLGIVPATR